MHRHVKIRKLTDTVVEEVCSRSGSSRDPDYVGAWSCDNFETIAREQLTYVKGALPSPKYNRFHLWINLKSSSEESEFTGRSVDVYGWAAVSGILTPNSIVFAKRYCKAATVVGGRNGELLYEGVRHRITTGQLVEEYISGLITQEGENPMKPLPFIMLNTPERFSEPHRERLPVGPV